MNTRRYILNKLKEINISAEEISAETNFIMENYLNIHNLYSDYELSQSEKENLENILEKRKTGYPLQYILGIADFMGEKFLVNESVLIPRQETEILVAQTTEKASKFDNPTILDIGTGTGCIAIMLKKKINSAKVVSCDISEQAINTAKENAKKLNADVSFVHSDIFSNIQEKFDIIVSNPPYIPPKEKATIQKEVSFEPASALYTSDEFGIEFYEKIIKTGKNYLTKNGCILFELGIKQADMVKKIFEDYNYREIEIIKDLDNIKRVISAKV